MRGAASREAVRAATAESHASIAAFTTSGCLTGATWLDIDRVTTIEPDVARDPSFDVTAGPVVCPAANAPWLSCRWRGEFADELRSLVDEVGLSGDVQALADQAGHGRGVPRDGLEPGERPQDLGAPQRAHIRSRGDRAGELAGQRRGL